MKADFTRVDFSGLEEEDTQWTEDVRESGQHLVDRVYRALHAILKRKETHVALFSHSAFLFSVFSKYIICHESDGWLQTGEMKAVYVTFEGFTS